MQYFVLFSWLALVQSVLGQANSSSVSSKIHDLLAQSNRTTPTLDLNAAARTDLSSNLTDGSTTLQDSIINFSEAGFTFIGRKTPDEAIPPGLVAAAGEAALLRLRSQAPDNIVLGLPSISYRGAKMSWVVPRNSQQWNVRDFLTALTIAFDHLRGEAAPYSLQLTIASSRGQRLIFKIESVPCEYNGGTYGPPDTPRASRYSLEAWWYDDDRFSIDELIATFLPAVEWASRSPGHDSIPPGFYEVFPGTSYELRIQTALASPETSDIDYEQLSWALTLISELATKRLDGRWRPFQARLYDSQSKDQAYIFLQRIERPDEALQDNGVSGNTTVADLRSLALPDENSTVPTS